jgi:hypothetical protein
MRDTVICSKLGTRRSSIPMRTTLDIDSDVLQAAKEIAAGRGITAGKALSDLARRGLMPKRPGRVRNGVPLLPRRPADAPRPTMKRVNELRDDP